MKDEALKLALEALEYLATQIKPDYEHNKAITAIKQALAAPVQQSRSDVEPVAWMSKHDVGFIKSEFGATPTVPLYTTPPAAQPAPVQEPIKWTNKMSIDVPHQELYTTPPAAQRQWQSLTDEEWQDLSDRYGMILFSRFKNEIETKLREKNTP